MQNTTLAPGWRPTFARSSITQKAVVGATGLLLATWTFAHMAGSLAVFAGPEVMNGYAALLRASGLLWVMRIGLLLALLAHALLALRLGRASACSRGSPYRRVRYRASSLAGRTMSKTALLLAAWLVYHVLHMYGPAHAQYIPGDVHHNLVTGLASPAVAGSYVVASVLLALHLSHGLPSVAATFGVSQQRRRGYVRLASVLVWLLTLGFLAPPLAALLGFWSPP